MPTTFAKPINKFSTTLLTAHTSGSGTLVLRSVSGLGSLDANQVFRVTALASPNTSSETVVGIFEATGISGSTLTGVTAVEGYSDTLIAANTTIQIRATAKTFTDLQSAVNTLETAAATYALDSAVVHDTGDETIAGTKTFSTTIVGSISGNAATVTNGVYTSGSYANPSWITSLAGSKVSGDIAGNAANVSGIVAIANGGTGTASPGLIAGSNVTISGTWPNQTIAATDPTSPGGSSGQIQYNNAGAFAGASSVTYAASGNILTVAAPTKTDVPLTIAPLIGTSAITNVAIASNIATITTSAAHGFVVGRLCTIAGATPSGLNGRWNILSVPTSTTCTVWTSAGDSASASSGGTISSATQTAYPLAVMDSGSLTALRFRPYCSSSSTDTGTIDDYHCETYCDTPNVSGTTFYRGWLSYNLPNTGNQDAARIALKVGTSPSTLKVAAAIDMGIYGSGGVMDFWTGGDHSGGAAKMMSLTRTVASFPLKLSVVGGPGSVTVGTTNSADANAVVRVSNSLSTSKLLVLQKNKIASAASILELQNTDDGPSVVYSRIDPNYRWQIGSGTMSDAMLGVLADAAATPVLNVCGTASQTGALVTLAGESSTTARQPMGYIDAAWSVSTHASRLADLVLSTTGYNGTHEAIRFRDTGSISQPIIPIANVRDAADDTAAAALSPAVPVGGLYRTGSLLKIRVS